MKRKVERSAGGNKEKEAKKRKKAKGASSKRGQKDPWSLTGKARSVRSNSQHL